ncbi:MAG: SUMF1/EgtB/PvdO family nonheme iron enzyme [Deltaproteobacteria bacterium]|nr:SUMF1/EgtB/PvdO family nonheme iron enzyme [Deltaproteobacteria bacterium]
MPHGVAIEDASVDVTPRLSCPDGAVLVPARHVALSRYLCDNWPGDPETVCPQPIELNVPAFCVDRFEVSAAQVLACVQSGACIAHPWLDLHEHPQWGCDLAQIRRERMEFEHSRWCTLRDPLQGALPANCVRPLLADAFCRHAGGALMSEEQWQAAAMPPDQRPELEHIVQTANLLDPVSRQRFGSILYQDDSPATQDSEPFLRPTQVPSQDVSRDGVYELFGNVAEWVTRTSRVPEGDSRLGNLVVVGAPFRGARGGHFLEADPRGARAGITSTGGSACLSSATIGFRCAYAPR